MSLQAIIIRADGVVAETDALERSVLNHVVETAGFHWKCSREAFRELRAHPQRRDRYRHFVRKNLGFDRSSEDFERLIDVMSRHASTVIRERLENDYVDPCLGIRELATAARGEGVKVAAVTALPTEEAEHLVASLFGDMGKRLFACIESAAEDQGTAGLHAAYEKALQNLNVDPSACLALEASPEGSHTARQAGIPAVILLGHHEPGSCQEALFTIDTLSDLIRLDDNDDVRFLTPGDGSEILAALRRAHAGYFDLFGNLHRSYAMKVSDILKDKGSTVKAIQATESIFTLAQRLKAEGVGAMVVIAPNGHLDGIISERDIANGLASHGEALPRMLVGDLMTRAVITCGPDDAISAVAKIMTQRRFRHMPVEKDGALIGLVSIGDVLKHRLDELQLETNVLRDFVIARG